jgi:hypothetical protein
MKPEKPPEPIILSSRSQRRIDEKNFNSFTIKCGLDKSLQIDEIFKADFLKNINYRVEAISKGTHKLSILVNILIRECLEKTKNPLQVKIPNFLTDKDTTFARQLMIGLDGFEKNTKPNDFIFNFLKRNEHIIKHEKFRRFQGDRNSISRACEAYLTNYRTYITEIFENKQTSFLFLWCTKNGIDLKCVKYIRYLINGWDIKQTESHKIVEDIIKNLKHEQSIKIKYFVSFQRKLLHLNENDKVQKSWIKNNYETVIIYYSVLSKYFKRNGKKQILIAPLNKIKAMYLHIDTEVFYGILKEERIPTENAETIRNSKLEYFNKVFKINKLLTETQVEKGFYFTGTIMTDGTAINFIFKRPKLIKNEEENLDRNEPNIRIIANDPGRTTLFCGIEKLDDNSIKEYSFTRKYFHTVSGAKKAVKKSNYWNQKYLKEILETLSQTNSRNAKLTEFLEYVKIIKDNYNTLWGEGLKKHHSRQRFSLYSGKKKAYDTFFKSLNNPNDNRKTIIAYGDAGFASTAKYELSAPTTTLEKQCNKWFKIVKVHEFRTTQLYSETNEILCKVNEIKQNKTAKQTRTVRELLWYRKTNEVCKFINRDINAAKNILKCYRMFPNRPHGMGRKDDRQEIPEPHKIKSKEKLLSVIPTFLEYEDLARFNSYF